MLFQKWKSILCLLLIFTLLVACSKSTPQPTPQAQNDVTDLNWHVPNFTAIDQEGKQVTLNTLKGKVWLTHFLFTRCPNICPPMTANLASVQQALKKAGVQVTMVSFTVDPDYDQPAVLKKFALEHGAELSNWHFLTGYAFSDIQKICQIAFKGQITKVESNDPKVILYNHPSKFYLVDQTGKVRKFYDGLRPDIKLIVKDASSLTRT